MDIMTGAFYGKFRDLKESYPDSSTVPIQLLKKLQAEYRKLDIVEGLEEIHAATGAVLDQLIKAKELMQ